MADNQDKMNQQQMLAAIAEAYRRRDAGQDPYSDPKVRQVLPERAQPNIAPPKVDPEAIANAQINRAASRPGQMDADAARKTMNPATGLPYSVGSNEEVSPEEQAEKEKAQMKLQYLRDMASSGKFGK